MNRGGAFIGQVARQTGLSIHAIRFYEREGLLKEPVRSEGGYRVFDEQTVSDVKFIRRAQELGFSLAEIRELLVLRRSSDQACPHVRDLLRQKLSIVEDKVRELEGLREDLKAALRVCNRDLKRHKAGAEKHCPVLEKLGHANGDQEV